MMAGTTRTNGATLSGGLGAEDQPFPAEVHDAICRRLEELAVRWSLKPTEVLGLSRQMLSRTYLPGEVILPYQARPDFLGFIVHGQVGVYEGRQRANWQVSMLLPGGSFGDITPEEPLPSRVTVQALASSEILFLRRADLLALAKERRWERNVATLRQALTWVASVAAVCLVFVLILGLPQARRMVAVTAMGLGQWCDQGGKPYGRCTERAWTTAANLTPDDANPLLALGTFYFGQGRVEEAERSFEAAKAIAPDWGAIHNNLGVIYAGRGQYQQAVMAFERALDLEPGTFAVEHNLGCSLQAMQAYQEALTHYERALAFGEPQVNTLANMAVDYYEIGQLDKAAEAAQQALRYDEGKAPAYTVLGAVALALQQPELALPLFRKAITLDRDSSRAHFYLGLAYKELGMSAEAVSSFEQALATTGDVATRTQIRRHLREFYEAEGWQEAP